MSAWRRPAMCGGAALVGLAAPAWMLGLRPYVERRDLWSIAIYEGADPFAVAPREGAFAPDLTAADVSDRAAIFVADPFLLRTKGLWHLFFEVLTQQDGREDGVIGLATSADGGRFTYAGVVLDEPFHLSHPYVFEWEGEHYMVPESGRAHAVRLYRAARFPDRWEHAATLLRAASPVDPSLLHHAGRWWLFVETSLGRHDTLRLFLADDLSGPYREHPLSPIVRGADRARPAGRVLAMDGRLYRIAQNCEPTYGSAVRAFEILELTDDAYREREIQRSPVLGSSGSGWNSAGMHSLDPHPLAPGRWIAAVDGQRLAWRLGLRWR